MVKWDEGWLLKKDVNEHIIKDWARKLDCDSFLCILCNKSLKYSTQGFQALIQHSDKRDHKAIAKTRFSDTQVHIRTQKPVASISKLPPLLETSVNNNIFSAETSWLYKITEEDFSLRSCDDLNLLFRKMFPDSGIAEHSHFLDKRLLM